MGRSAAAAVFAILGASGSGKTSYVMAEIKRAKPSRLLIWDTKGEFAAEGYGVAVSSMSALVAAVAAAGKRGGFRLAYRPTIGTEKQMSEAFNVFCRVAFAAKNLTVIAEELSDVTTASHAVAGWRRLTSQGRTEGVTLYGLSQHPASIDKHFFGNASFIRAGRLNYESHIRTVANVIGVPKDEIQNMLPLQWVSKDMNTGKVERGKVPFRKQK
jgi:hypothetical protein